MARFDVYRLASQRARLVLDVQADLLGDLATRAVVPLRRAKPGREHLSRLSPKVTIGSAEYVLITAEIAALSTTLLGEQVANIEDDYREEVIDALDFLFQGF